VNTLEIPGDVIARAQSIADMASRMPLEDVTAMLAPWVREAPEAAVVAMVALAAMADGDKYVKEAHAAYNRGDRTDFVVVLERQYQRDRQRRNRPYLSVRRGGAAEEEEGERGA